MSGLRERAIRESNEVKHAIDSEKCRLQHEIRNLEEELATLDRIARGEDERLAVRRNLYESELHNLRGNLNKNIDLTNQARDHMHHDIATKRVEGNNIYLNLKREEDDRVANIKSEYQKAKNAQRDLIRDKETQIAGEFLKLYDFYRDKCTV